MTAQPKPTAADVLREHGIRRESASLTEHPQRFGCWGPGCDWTGDSSGHSAHQAAALAAAGLLATAEQGSASESERDAVGRLLWERRGGSLRPGSWDDPVLFTERVKESWRREADEVLSSRWLAEHDGQVAAQALRDAANQEAPAAVEARRWLSARADRIAGGAT